MKKQQVLILLDIFTGPLAKHGIDGNGNEITKIKIVDNDQETMELDREIRELWDSLFLNYTSNPVSFDFDKVKEYELAPKFLELLGKLNKRLNDINDGSLYITDWATPYFEDLLKNGKK